MNSFKTIVSNGAFWAALIGFVTAILVAFNVPQGTVEQIASIISAASIVIAYIVGDGIKQAATIKANSLVEAEKVKQGK